MSVFWDLKLHSLSTQKNKRRFLQNTCNNPPNSTSSCPRILWSDYITFKITDDNDLVKLKLNKRAVQESYVVNVCVTENSGILGHEVVRNSNPNSLSLLPVSSQHLRTVHTTEHHIHSFGFHATAAWMLSE